MKRCDKRDVQDRELRSWSKASALLSNFSVLARKLVLIDFEFEDVGFRGGGKPE